VSSLSGPGLGYKKMRIKINCLLLSIAGYFTADHLRPTFPEETFIER
jgi:hypothetical protein